MDKEEVENYLKKLRDNNFAVKIEEDKYQDNCHILGVTHNGYQWSTIGATKQELIKIRDIIDAFLNVNLSIPINLKS